MKATTTDSSADVERQLRSFIAKFEPGHQTLICAVRKALRKRFPTGYELAWLPSNSAPGSRRGRHGPPLRLSVP